jgi:hypothetical protein
MRRLTMFLAVLATALVLRAASVDPLADEIAKWQAFLASDKATGETWSQIKPGMEPLLGRAQDALKKGQRMLALNRFAVARANLEGALYASSRSEREKKEQAQFEAERNRMGKVLQASLKAPASDAFKDIEPAFARALAEVSAMHIRGYFDASLEYSRNTMPETGLFYVGAAKAEKDLIDFLRSLPDENRGALPPVRSLSTELDALQHELLALYVPPASIDRHPEFIGASSMLKEARELDAAGLQYGALFRYLDATRRMATIRGSKMPAAEVAKQLDAYESRAAAGGTDHSIGQLFVENARNDAALAPIIVESVLPRYFAALQPATIKPKQADAQVTVTLVRWPYT